MLKAVPIVGCILALAACATARGPRPSPAPPAAVSASGDSRARIVDGAKAMLGQPYRFGGAAPGGFDCSGLVVYAMRGAGLHVPRTAHEQLRAGAPVPRRAMRAGDLVFFHLARNNLHVGIAIDGDRFVHAPSGSGHVRIDSLAAPPYAHAFLAARRVVDDPPPPRTPHRDDG